jgi:hypothetical protein
VAAGDARPLQPPVPRRTRHLNEATHAANGACGVDDFSASQYHNKYFRKRAEELRLVQRADAGEKWKKEVRLRRYGVE